MKFSRMLSRLVLGILFFSACSQPKEFKLYLLPDTQFYSLNHPEVFEAQTQWIVENTDSVAFVIHQGDLTHHNTEKEWKVAVEAMSLLDDKIPYTFVPGNHDMGEMGSAKTRETDRMNEFFPYEKYSRMKGFGGVFEEDKMDNTWHTFTAASKNWLILSLEFGPRNKVLEWASSIIKNHPEHNVIINTHAYMYSDETRMSSDRDHLWLPESYGIGEDTGSDAVNNGGQMWEKLVSRHTNILMVVSGHVLNDGTGKLVSKGENGNQVYQMLANYQSGVNGSENGGNGFLRILTFNLENATIDVKTYSPYLDRYKQAEDQQFSFEDVDFNPNYSQ